MPTRKVCVQPDWTYLNELNLTDPTLCEPGKIDILLGIEVYLDTIRTGRCTGPHKAPVAVETGFGWEAQMECKPQFPALFK